MEDCDLWCRTITEVTSDSLHNSIGKFCEITGLGRNAATARIIPRRDKNPRFVISFDGKLHFHFRWATCSKFNTAGSQQSTFIHFCTPFTPFCPTGAVEQPEMLSAYGAVIG
jgi:hypothetical protein